MVHTFKFGGQRIAYHNVSGLVLPLSELADNGEDVMIRIVDSTEKSPCIHGGGRSDNRKTA